MVNIYKSYLIEKRIYEVKVVAPSETEARRLALAEGIDGARKVNESIMVDQTVLIAENAYRVGDRIKHKHFGMGLIVEMESVTEGLNITRYILKINFDGGDSKIIVIPAISDNWEVFS